MQVTHVHMAVINLYCAVTVSHLERIRNGRFASEAAVRRLPVRYLVPVQLQNPQLATSGVKYCSTGTTSVTLIRVGPPGYFVHVSITTPVVSALKNYYT